jgi:hypothetical protein
VHAVDGEETPTRAPVLPLDRAPDAAEQPGYGCAHCAAPPPSLTVLKGFAHGFG